MNEEVILILIISYVIIYGRINTKNKIYDNRGNNSKYASTDQNEVSMVEEEREQGVVERNEEIEEVGIQRYDTAYEETEVTKYIKEVFEGDAGFALSLAFCESTLGLDLVSPSGAYLGLFQFSEVTWNEQCTGDIWNYRDQVDCTKKLIDRGEYGRWPNCP